MSSVIESISVFRNYIRVSVTNSSNQPVLIYDGVAIEDIHSMASGNNSWTVYATIPIDHLENSKISIIVDGNIFEAPGNLFGDAEDRDDWNKMQVAFTALTEGGGRALEIGSRARSGNSYRSLFHASCEYTGMDVLDGPNVDVVGDAHHLSRFVKGPFDYVFSIAVFEHLLMPWKAAIEMNKVMAEGGMPSSSHMGYGHYMSSHGIFGAIPARPGGAFSTRIQALKLFMRARRKKPGRCQISPTPQ